MEGLMWKRLILVAALVIGGTVAAAAPAQADSPPPVCNHYYDGATETGWACADVVHTTAGPIGKGSMWCYPYAYHATSCVVLIARIRLYVDGTLWREYTGLSSFDRIEKNIQYYCSGVRHVFQVWMTYEIHWYNQYGQVHEIDQYLNPLTSYPEYAC